MSDELRDRIRELEERIDQLNSDLNFQRGKHASLERRYERLRQFSYEQWRMMHTIHQIVELPKAQTTAERRLELIRNCTARAREVLHCLTGRHDINAV